ncbi:MAG: TlpA family protein disulfide reductase [Treponema sp.]|nr:TlpA family protein disulfide reductase [Candidatus Treponema equifaecale]
MKKIKTLFAAVTILLSTTAFAQKFEFAAKDINNKNITEAVFADSKLTMVNIWGTFCGPCISEMPDLGKLNKDYAEKGFQVAGIVIDAANRKGNMVPKTVEAAKKIVKQTGADYLHIVPDSKMQSGVLADVMAVPTTFFVDKDGNIVGEVYTGSRSYSDWQKIVEELLKKV